MKRQSAGSAHPKTGAPTNHDRDVARRSLNRRGARRWRRRWAYGWGRGRRRCRWSIWVGNRIGNSCHPKLIHGFEEKPIRILLHRDDTKATTWILEIAFAPRSVSRGGTVERHSYGVWGGNAHLGKTRINAVINRAQ